jgi:hypothetical protein
MNPIKRIQLEICWKRGHRLYLGNNPGCGTCMDRRQVRRMKEVKDAKTNG